MKRLLPVAVDLPAVGICGLAGLWQQYQQFLANAPAIWSCRSGNNGGARDQHSFSGDEARTTGSDPLDWRWRLVRPSSTGDHQDRRVQARTRIVAPDLLICWPRKGRQLPFYHRRGLVRKATAERFARGPGVTALALIELADWSAWQGFPR